MTERNKYALFTLWLPLFGSMLSGLLLALAFPGFSLESVAFFGLVPLMYAVHNAPPRRAALLGLLSGFVFFLGSLSWMGCMSAMVESFGMKLCSWLAYGILALYCALYFIPFALVVSVGTQQWGGGNVRKNLRLMFAISMVWVAMEYLRSFLFTGFPWNPLGVSQYTNLAVIQMAEWGGVYIISACIVWLNAAIFITLRQYTHGDRMKRYRPHMELMLGLLPLALCVAYGMNILFNRPPSYETVRAALIQPNIAQTEKWDDALEQKIRQRLEELTSAATQLEGLDLVIWPETALPDHLRCSQDSYDLVVRLAEAGVPLLVGTMDFSVSEDGHTYHNSSVLLGAHGEELQKYDKQHLVPFGEYVPFPGLMRKFTPVEVDFGGGTESTIFRLHGSAAFSPLICFEDTIPPLALKATRAGARWLINQTNDGWFDPSAQSEQHLAHAVFRCVENRIPMARACNTGVSCGIDAFGVVTRNLDVRTQGFTVVELDPRPVGLEETFYTRNGDAFAKVALLSAATVAFVLRTRRWPSRKAKGS